MIPHSTKYSTKHILLYILVLLALGCSKTGPTAVSGTTRDKTTQAPVPHAAVAVLERTSEILNFNPWGVVTTGMSDVDGHYYMAFDAKKGCDYRVVAQKDGFIDDGNAFADISAGQKNKHTDIPMSPSGILKLHIKNVHPYDANDVIGLRIGSEAGLYGVKIDTMLYDTEYGNNNFTLTGFYRKNNVTYGINQNIYIKEHDTTFYEILY